MKEETANQIAQEARELYPHVGTVVVLDKTRSTFIVGVYTPKDDIASSEHKMFTIGLPWEWEHIKKAPAVLVPQVKQEDGSTLVPGTQVRIHARGNCYCSELPHEDDSNTICDYCKYNGAIGTLAKINMDNDDGDFYGVQFLGSDNIIYFFRQELNGDELEALSEWTQATVLDQCETEQEATDPVATLLADYESYSLPTQNYLVKKLWKLLNGKAREKGYQIYCGRYERQFSILGHSDGWPSDYFSNYGELLRAWFWLDQQGPALSEDERIERRAHYWEERKAIEASYRQVEF